MSTSPDPIPEDPEELLAELDANAAAHRRAIAELEAIKDRRNALVAAVRDRKLRTWRALGALYGMTETALQIATKSRRN